MKFVPCCLATARESGKSRNQVIHVVVDPQLAARDVIERVELIGKQNEQIFCLCDVIDDALEPRRATREKFLRIEPPSYILNELRSQFAGYLKPDSRLFVEMLAG